MKIALIMGIASVFAVGCVADDVVVEGEDFDDPDAKYDGARQPAGLYNLLEPDSFDEGMPRIGILDLRSDGTFYSTEYGLSEFAEGNFSEHEDEIFGTYKFTRDGHGNTYIKFVDEDHPDSSWRWRYTLDGTRLDFKYRQSYGGFAMKRDPRPTASFVAKVKSTFATATRSPIADPTPTHWTDELPKAFNEKAFQLKLADVVGIEAWSYKVDGTKVFAIQYGPADDRQVEVYLKNSQLVARSVPAPGLVWSPLRP